MRATTAEDIGHTVLSMLLAVDCRNAAGNIEARTLSAGVKRATPAQDVHHPVLSMTFAVHRRIAALHIEARLRRAKRMGATPVGHTNHSAISMLICSMPAFCCPRHKNWVS